MAIAELARRVEGYVGINGVNVWGDIKKYVTDIEFVEVRDGETDSFDITLADPDKHFITDWIIDKGTILDAKFKLADWQSPGVEQWIDCGTFLCDALKVRGFPQEVTIKSLALPLNGTKNTRKWEKISISAIAKDICWRNKCELKYYASDITLKSRQQTQQTDIEFLYRLCSEYGFGMKAYRNAIVIFDREKQDAGAAIGEIDINKLCASSGDTYTLDDNEEGTYTGAKCTYKPEKSDKELTCTIGTAERLLVLDVSATSAAEAQLKAKAALYNANKERVKLKLVSMGGMLPVYPGSNYTINGLGKYSGKYAADRAAHKLTGRNGYSVTYEFHAVDIGV